MSHRLKRGFGTPSGFIPEASSWRMIQLPSRRSVRKARQRFFQSEATGVGKEPQASSDVGGTNVAGREHLPDSIIPAGGQITEDDAETAVEDAWDVLQEDGSGLDEVDDAGDVGPEVVGVRCLLPAADDRPGLAGDSGKEEMYQTAKGFSWEGGKVAP